MRKSFVYFMKPKKRKGPIKIGCSEVPPDRLEALSAWSPWPLELMGAVPGALQDEQFLHNCFANLHTHREWFRPGPELIACIAKILAAGTIDVVRGEISPIGNIRKTTRRKRTDEERLRFSYSSRVASCEKKTRKGGHQAWYAPGDVNKILSRWRGYRWWSPEAKEYVVQPPTAPTTDELARLDEYLADPVSHSVVPSWSLPKEPICIPHIAEAA